jgi:hypothetical protein
VFAAAFHQDHRFINSHRCAENDFQTYVACACTASAWGKDTDEAVAKIGGSRG